MASDKRNTQCLKREEALARPAFRLNQGSDAERVVSSYQARNILASGSRYVRSETSYNSRVRVIKPQEIYIRSDRYSACKCREEETLRESSWLSASASVRLQSHIHRRNLINRLSWEN